LASPDLFIFDFGFLILDLKARHDDRFQAPAFFSNRKSKI